LRRRGFAKPSARRILDLSWVNEPSGVEYARCAVRLSLSDDCSGYIDIGPSPTVLRQRAATVVEPGALAEPAAASRQEVV